MSQPQIKTDIEARVQDTGDIMTGPLYFKQYGRINEAHPTDLNYTALCLDAVNNNYFIRLALFCHADGTWGYPALQKWDKNANLLEQTQIIYNHFPTTFHSDVNDNNFLLGKDSTGKVILRHDGDSFWILLTDPGKNTWNDLRPLRIQIEDGQVWIMGGKPYTSTNKPTPEDIGALPLSGKQAMTGTLKLKSNLYTDAREGALDMSNSNIYNLNSIYFADSSDNSSEGIHFYNNSTSVDTIWANGGNLYFTPNRTLGDAGTSHSILHTGNFSTYALSKSGGIMSGSIQTSFRHSVAMGSYQAAAQTVPNLVEEVRYSNGVMGSVSLTESYTASAGGNIVAGWYNFIYSPHRSGGNNGAASGDNHNYGTLILTGMTVNGTAHWRIRITGGAISESRKIWEAGDSVTGAVWNDYAEHRESNIIEPGYVLAEAGDDTLVLTTERLQAFCGVSSDTWGFSQGETEKAKTPIAVAGRVLVYPAEPRDSYAPGDCVCAGPGGTVSKMTREEIKEYPDRIVGKVSCIPEYETWGGGENADREPISVNGRIWIQVK